MAVKKKVIFANKPPKASADRRTKAELLAELERSKRQVRASEEVVSTLSASVRLVRNQRTEQRQAKLKAQKELRDARVELARLQSPPVFTRSEYDLMIETTVAAIPEEMRKIVMEVATDPSMNEIVKLFMERERDFATPQRALLAGIAMDKKARSFLDREVDLRWQQGVMPVRSSELVIGGGLHAAIYCAVRVAKGFPKPYVLDGSERPGGAFSAASGAVFYLNSRNRPGELSLPGLEGALNVLPGAPLQPSELGGDEYQTNDSLGFLSRMSLMMHSNLCRAKVASIRRTSGGLEVLNDKAILRPSRVIVATGLGVQKQLPAMARNERVLSFDQFMRRMDGPFPLRGMNRVAVIGAGDSGKTVIESLTGQGPPLMSTVALDYPQRIDWYGVPDDRSTKEKWETCARSRYKGIGRLFGFPDGRPARVRPIELKASSFGVGFDCVYVNNLPYDYVVNCTGYFPGPTFDTQFEFSTFASGGRIVGRAVPGRQVYMVGPAANLPVAPEEEVILRGVAENSTSLFRYAPRTAALAAALPAP